MKNPNYKGIELLPLSVIEAARAGDSEAVERVLRYYEGYINKLCTRTLYDEYGQPHVCVDEYMKRRLEIKLIPLSAWADKPGLKAETAYPFPVSLFRGRRQHLDKESPLGGQRRSIRQTDTFLFVPSHTVGAP